MSSGKPATGTSGGKSPEVQVDEGTTGSENKVTKLLKKTWDDCGGDKLRICAVLKMEHPVWEDNDSQATFIEKFTTAGQDATEPTLSQEELETELEKQLEEATQESQASQSTFRHTSTESDAHAEACVEAAIDA